MGVRAQRALRLTARSIVRLLSAAVIALVFAVAAVFGVVLHVDLPAGRRIAAATLTRLLSRTFKGDLVIERIERAHWYGVIASDITVTDPRGNVVLRADRLRARANLPELVREALLGAGRLEIGISHVRIERAEVYVIPDPETGVPTIAEAFTPVAAEQPTPSTEPSRDFSVWLPNVELGQTWGRVQFANGPTLEAELGSARGSVHVTNEGTAIDVRRFGVTARGLAGADAVGTADFHLRAPDTRLWTSFDGHFGEVETQALFKFSDDGLALTVELPRAKPDDLRALYEDWPVYRPVRAHVEARGRLPDLDLQATAVIEGSDGAPPATVIGEGTLTLSPDVAVSIDAKGQAVDARAFLPDAPATSVNLAARVELWNRNGQAVVDVNGTTMPTSVGGVEVPAIDLTGTYTADVGFAATATLHEPRVPLKVDFTITPEGVIDGTARARGFYLQHSPRLRRYVQARGFVSAEIKARLEEGVLDARVRGDVNDLTTSELALDGGKLVGRIRGSVARPEQLRVDAAVNGTGLRASGYGFEQVEARAEGPVTRPRVALTLQNGTGPDVRASGVLALTGAPGIDELDVSLQREDTRLVASAGRVRWGADRVELTGLQARSAQTTLSGNLDWSDDELELQIQNGRIDLDELAALFNLPEGVLTGVALVDADIVAGPDGQRGTLALRLERGGVGTIADLSLALRATLQGPNLTGSLEGALGKVAAVGASWDTRLGGSISRLESWRDMLGVAQVQLKHLDLAPLLLFFPPDSGIDEFSGQASAQFRLERRVPAALPSVFMVGGTRYLRIEQSGENDEPGRVITGLDLQLGGDISGETGRTNLTARVIDDHGVWVTANARADLALNELVDRWQERARVLLETPLEAIIDVPERNLSEWPSLLQPRDLDARVGARVAVIGPLGEPVISAVAHANNLRALTSRYALPVDLGARLEYETATGQLGASAEALQKGVRVAALAARAQQSQERGFIGGAQLSLSGLPLQIFTPLADAQIGGQLYGVVAFKRHQDLPELAANVQVQQLAVDTLPIGEGRIRVDSHGSAVLGSLQFAHGTGKLEGTASLGLSWDGLVPSVDEAQPVRLALDAESYNAAILRPIAADVFSELRGTLHAEVEATLHTKPDPEEYGARAWTGEISGDAVLQDGTIGLAAFGLELNDVTLQASASGSADQTRIVVTQMDAKARSADVNLRARAELSLVGFQLASASATANLRDVPLLLQGVPQANATGRAQVWLRREPDRIAVRIDLRDMVARLPKSTGRALIELADNTDIKVLQPLAEPVGPEEVGGRITPWDIEIAIGQDVRVVRNDIDVPLAGRPVLHLAEEVEMSGEIVLEPGGRVQLMGKSFVIEGGRIRFINEDPANPALAVTASWQAPQHLVYVEIRGTVKQPVITFRSDPPLPQSDVVASLLGGSGEAGAALAVGSGLGASIFNELFSDTPLGTVELRTSETEGGVGVYTAALQVSDEVWIEANYYRPQRNTTQVQATINRIGVSGTVDWRFHRNWSLRTELGDIGAGADLLWQYRY